MKRFIISVLCVAVFFIGLGGLLEKTTANFKSDEKALELIRKARLAIGGEANINNVRSMTIAGKIAKTLDFDGSARIVQGDMEINFELPNRLSKQLRLGNPDGAQAAFENQRIEQKVNVVVMNKSDSDVNTVVSSGGNSENRVFTVKKGDGDKLVINGDNANGEPHKIIVDKDIRVAGNGEQGRQNELFRTTFALLLAAPEGTDVSYVYGGETSVDGSSCEIIEAQTNGSAVKLYLDKSTSLPRMVRFQSAKPLIFKFNKDEAKGVANNEKQIVLRRLDAPETAEFQIKFTDFRSTDGLQLPHKWTQTIAGKDDEVFDIANYEVNPAAIAEKFKEMPTKIMIRTTKP